MGMIGLLVLLGVLGQIPARAAPTGGAAQVAPAADSTRPVVKQVRIRGNDHFSTGELKKRLRTTRNRRVLGIPGFTWWRWIYRLGSADWVADRVGKALRSGGEPPAYLDSTTVSGDVERLQLFYEQEGFRDAEVSSSIRLTENDTRATVTFRVAAGPATYLRRFEYDGLDVLSAEQRRALARGTVLNAGKQDAETPLSFRVEDQRFQKPLLLEERRRVLSFLQDAGYAAVSRDSIRAIVYSHDTPPGSLDVALRVETGPQYRFGDVHFQIQGPEEAAPRRDTLDVSMQAGPGPMPLVTSTVENETQLGMGLLRRSLQFVPGTTYQRSTVLNTKRRLEGTGVFTLTSLTPQFDAVTTVDSVRYLPMLIEGQTRQRHRLRMEAFGLQRANTNFGSSEFGIGLGGGYENVNALGGGETFELRASGSVATLAVTFFGTTFFSFRLTSQVGPIVSAPSFSP